MTIRVPNEGEVQLLGMMLGKTSMETFRLKLFTNNITPAETDTSASYTEASGFGYAAIDLTASNWTVGSGDPADASYPLQSFSFTGALGNVYGYYVVGVTSGKVLWAERFSDGPYSITQSGDSIKVTPKFQLKDTLDA